MRLKNFMFMFMKGCLSELGFPTLFTLGITTVCPPPYITVDYERKAHLIKVAFLGSLWLYTK